MKKTPNHYNEEFSDDSSNSDHNSATGLALLNFEEGEPNSGADEAPAEWTGPCCEKCEAPLKAGTVTICRRCGWYASLGTFVEVDPTWEAEDEPNEPVSPARRLSHIGVWINLLPKWAWLIVASVFAVVIESIAVRLATPAGSSIRTVWSLSQLALGGAVFAGCHILNFLGLVSDDTEVGVMDVLIKPVKLWVRSAHNLPDRLWVTNSAACGLTAAAMSVLVIGGLPYESLWDWGFKEPPKQNLMGAVMDRVKEVEGQGDDKSLEDAVKDFAGSQNVDPNANKPTPPPKPREKADCVILGYQLDQDGRLSSLALGTANRGQLVFAGQVTPQLSADEAEQLVEWLAEIRVGEPLIKVQMAGAIWVKPQYTCRITYGERQKAGRLTDVKWDKMLGVIRNK